MKWENWREYELRKRSGSLCRSPLSWLFAHEADEGSQEDVLHKFREWCVTRASVRPSARPSGERLVVSDADESVAIKGGDNPAGRTKQSLKTEPRTVRISSAQCSVRPHHPRCAPRINAAVTLHPWRHLFQGSRAILWTRPWWARRRTPVRHRATFPSIARWAHCARNMLIVPHRPNCGDRSASGRKARRMLWLPPWSKILWQHVCRTQ